MFDLPNDIVDSLLSVGRVEWAATEEQTDEQHIADFTNTLRITRDHFGISDEKTALQGVYLEGEQVVLCHTGMSPNSPQHARILAGAWNQLLDMARAQRFQEFVESGANAAADNPAPEVSAAATRTATTEIQND